MNKASEYSIKRIQGFDIKESIYMPDKTDEGLITANIVDIYWERVLLKVSIIINWNQGVPERDLDFYLVSDQNRANGKFKILSVNAGVYTLALNITNPGYGLCLTPATYRIRICNGDDIIGIPMPIDSLASRLDDLSKTFLHGRKKLGYNVDFSISEKEIPEILVLTQEMERTRINTWRYRSDDYFKVSWKRRVKNVLFSKTNINDVLPKMYQKYLNALGNGTGEKKYILFLSEQSEKLGANLTCVMERMRERGLDEEYSIFVSARNISKIDDYDKRSWEEVIRKVARADLIFVDDHVPFLDHLILDPKTTLVQLWHAGPGYKAVGYSRWGKKGAANVFSCHRQYDFCITPSSKIAFFFSEQFGINEEQVITTGLPRMDEYISPKRIQERREAIYNSYPLLKGKSIILFAPTYRGVNKKEAYYPYEKIDFERLYELCRDEYIVAFKMHPWVGESVPIPKKYADKMIDLSKKCDIYDLFYVADIMITDYSSNVFEFSLMKKPMLFYAFDEHQYMYSRGFHRDYRSACPGKVCGSFDEVIKSIEEKDFQEEKLEGYLDYHYEEIDGLATDRVIDWFVLDELPDKYVERLKQVFDDMNRMKALKFGDSKQTEIF